MKIDIKCPQCKENALSKLRKVTILGLIITCRNCKAELGITSTFSIGSFVAFVIGLVLIRVYTDTLLFWLGWIVLAIGSTYHLATVPLKVRNKGPDYADYNS